MDLPEKYWYNKYHFIVQGSKKETEMSSPESAEVVHVDNGVGNVNLVTSEGSDHASKACLICNCLLGLE